MLWCAGVDWQRGLIDGIFSNFVTFHGALSTFYLSFVENQHHTGICDLGITKSNIARTIGYVVVNNSVKQMTCVSSISIASGMNQLLNNSNNLF